MGFWRKLGHGLAKAKPVLSIGLAIADQAGVPFSGLAARAVQAAEGTAGSGRDRATAALTSVLADAPGAVEQLEARIGRPVPVAAAVAYWAGQVELHYQLLRSAGVVGQGLSGAAVPQIVKQSNDGSATADKEREEMGMYTTVNAKENATIAQAERLVKQRQALGLTCLGIVAHPGGGGVGSLPIVEQSEFASTPEIAPFMAGPLFLHIRKREGDKSDLNDDEYVNVGMQLDTIRRAPNARDAAARLIAGEDPINTSERLSRLPGVAEAIESAIQKVLAV